MHQQLAFWEIVGRQLAWGPLPRESRAGFHGYLPGSLLKYSVLLTLNFDRALLKAGGMNWSITYG